MRCVILAAILFVHVVCCRSASVRPEWVRAGVTTNALVWGWKGGLLFAIPPAGFHSPEPRGLIRLGYPVLTNGGYDLINFIAIEPTLGGRKGFSELEQSKLDSAPGKRLTVITHLAQNTNDSFAGRISTIAPEVEQLTVHIAVERFENGAEPWIEIQQRSDTPDEITLITHAKARMESCILTATMGNRTRARELWLRDGKITSHQLYPNYRENQFAPHTSYPVDRWQRLKNGDAIVAIANDEENPSAVQPFPNPNFWFYRGAKVTQYWKKPAADGKFPPDLTAVVNARFVYWGSRQPIPGGISFENFELHEPYRDGNRYTFGITRKTPTELGFEKIDPLPR